MKFCKNLKGKECESCHSLPAFFRGVFALHKHMEGPHEVPSLIGLTAFPTSSPLETYVSIIKPQTKNICEFPPRAGKWRWAATGIFSPSSPQIMPAKLKPPCWEQLQKELCHSPKQSSSLGQARNILNYSCIIQYISISHLGARTGERRGQGKKGICCLFGWYVCYSIFQEYSQCGLTIKSCGLSHKIEEKKIIKKSAGGNLQQGRTADFVSLWALTLPVHMAVTAATDLLWSPSLRQDQGL